MVDWNALIYNERNLQAVIDGLSWLPVLIPYALWLLGGAVTFRLVVKLIKFIATAIKSITK